MSIGVNPNIKNGGNGDNVTMKHTLTHGLQTENTHDGITRKFSLQRYVNDKDEESFFIVITTTGLYAEPEVTKISFTSMGYSLFCMFMQNAPHDLKNWEVQK